MATDNNNNNNDDEGGRTRDPSTNPKVSKLRQLITHHPSASSSSSDGWEKCWEEGVTPWDLGQPTPVVLHLLQTGALRKGRALVPGCGTGYDVVAMASPDRRVLGLDISSSAIEKAKQWSSSLPNANYFDFLAADFFTWQPTELFDLVFDYTFFCAIKPPMRSSWARKMSDILKPDGELMTLIYLINDQACGPPFNNSVADYEEVLNPIGFTAISIVDNELAIKPRRISEWMKSHQEFYLSESDYAMRIDLITKVFVINAAEEFFEGLPSAAKSSEVFTALLHAYAKAKLIEKTENLFERIKELNLSSSALTYNEMMALYMSVWQLDKVHLVIEELKRRKVSPDLFTYKLWISASAASLDVNGVRKILGEMTHDLNFDEGWKTYVRLADIYVTVGHFVSSDNSLIETEKKISQRKWITYNFVIILYSGLGNREGIKEIWKSLMTSQKMTSRNYLCVLSAHLVLGKTEGSWRSY